MSLALNTKHLSSFIKEEEYKAIYPQEIGRASCRERV